MTNPRLLAIDSESGTVFCRLQDDETGGTLPRFSENYSFENVTRSYARMINLVACRGTNLDNIMVGPCDLYGNIEKPHQTPVTIDISSDRVTINKKDHANVESQDVKTLLPPGYRKQVCANWISAKNDSKGLKQVRVRYNHNVGNSLFGDSGFLEIDENIELPSFDPIGVDLSAFKVKLVKNDVPFKITDKKLSAKDEFRPVSYYFGDHYADSVVNNGGGLFLETHQFTQTMTPLDENAAGFIVLGRWVDNEKLELIAVKVPFGYTLIVEPGCIHGDTTFKGMYMMAMTSNHITMQTADVVFLKNSKTNKNIQITVSGDNQSRPDRKALAPFFLPLNPTTNNLEALEKKTKGYKFVIQLLSLNSWNFTVYRRFGYNPKITAMKLWAILIFTALNIAALSVLAAYVYTEVSLVTAVTVIAISSLALFAVLLLIPFSQSVEKETIKAEDEDGFVKSDETNESQRPTLQVNHKDQHIAPTNENQHQLN
ncbi:hypothetical protein N9Y17_03590 [Gammaproteobacteria bacterium]|nr:hypothetical protein [Gammaproteobacteria bacterium]